MRSLLRRLDATETNDRARDAFPDEHEPAEESGGSETRLLLPKPGSPGKALAMCQTSNSGSGFSEGEIARKSPGGASQTGRSASSTTGSSGPPARFRAGRAQR